MSQISFFDGNKPFKFTKPVRLIELFAGIGSQAKALQRLGVDFKHYKEVTHSISGFNLSIDYYGQIKQKIMLCKHRKDEGYYVGVAYITSFENLTSNSCKTTTQFYFSKQEAKAEAKRLNAEQAALIKEFLEGGE